MIIGDGIMLGAGGEKASIFVTGLSETDTVTATKDGKSIAGKWIQNLNPAAHGLPDGYTELEHIESTGTQYIDTGVVPSEVGYKAEVGFCATSVPSSGESWILAAFKSSSAQWRCGFSNGSFYTSGGFSYSQTSSTTANTVADGTNTMKPALSLYLFSQHESSGAVHTGNSKYKLYYCNISNGDTAIRKFIPAKRNSDSVIGLYDLVSNTFFTNAGTGTFIAGAEIPQTIDGFLIDKIKDYGTWTITATDGTNTATQDVLVDSAIEYAVEMSYVMWLYKDGDPCEYVTGGWVNGGYNGGAGTFSKDDDHLTVKHPGNGAQLARTSNKIDLTPYNTVFAEVITSTDNYSAAAIRVKATPDYNDGSEGTVTEAAKVTVKTIIQTDVSTLSGEYYIKPSIYWGSYAYFYKIWLE